MKKLTVLSPLFFTLFLLSACNGSADGESPILDINSQGTTTINIGSLSSQLNTLPLGDLSSAEAESIVFMREEEKLARDVYSALYMAPIFLQISQQVSKLILMPLAYLFLVIIWPTRWLPM